MSGGKEHLQACERVFPVALALSFLMLFLNWLVALFIPIGYMLEFFIDPDLDELGITSAEGRMIHTVVLIPLVAWTTLYAKIIGKHRSFWSHTPVIGTLIRLCWMLFPFVALLWYWHILPNSYTPQIFLGIWLGLSMADTVHWLKDR